MDDLPLRLLDDDNVSSEAGRYSNSEALRLFKLFLQSKLSLEDAAKGIITMLPSQNELQRRTGEIDGLGDFFCQMAEQIPYHHSAQARLVQLIQTVARSPKLAAEADEKVCAASILMSYSTCD